MQSTTVILAATLIVVAVLVVMAGSVARHHRRSRQWAQLRANTDPLTGLLNRRGFDTRFTELVESSVDLGRAISVVTFDLDRYLCFREVNGREAADKGVRRVANILTNLSRDIDLVAHLDNDEFVVVLPGALAADALSYAERVAWALGSERVDPALRITTSSGIGSYVPGDASIATLVLRAEEALHEAKQAGRARAAWWEGGRVQVGDPVDVPKPIDDVALPPRPREVILRRNDVSDEPERASA